MNVLVEIPDKLLIILAFVVILLCAIGIIIYKVFTRKKIKPITEEERYDSEIGDDDSIPLTIEEFFEDENEIPEEELTEEQLEAKEELQRVFDKMSRDLENQKSVELDDEMEDEIEDFEREQEENAIISYQELIDQADSLKEKADSYENALEQKVDMKVNDAMKSYRKKEEKSRKKVESKMKKGFKNSEIISPIYGVQDNKNMVKLKKKTYNKKRDIISKAYEKDFDEEKTQNLDFLNSLKEFRRNL